MRNRIIGLLLASIFSFLACDISLADRRDDRYNQDSSINPSTGNPGPYYPEYEKPEHYQDRDHE